MADIEKNGQSNSVQITVIAEPLMQQLRELIENTRKRVASVVSDETSQLYWNVGNAINTFVLQGNRAEYGKQIVATVSRQLQEEYGTKGFEERTIRRMMQFAQMFPDFQIVSPLVSKLSGSHFLIVMPMKTSPESALHNTSPNCPRRKFSFANCKNPLKQQRRICLKTRRTYNQNHGIYTLYI